MKNKAKEKGSMITMEMMSLDGCSAFALLKYTSTQNVIAKIVAFSFSWKSKIKEIFQSVRKCTHSRTDDFDRLQPGRPVAKNGPFLVNL